MTKYYCKYCDFRTIRKFRLDEHVIANHDKKNKTVTKYFLALANKENLSKDIKLDTSNLDIIYPPKGHFYADPFLFNYNNENYVFFEDWDYNKGNIVCAKINNNNELENLQTCLDLDIHLSFPFVFKYNNNIYMIPETGSRNRIELYECISFPNKWKFKKILVNNIYAPDVSFLEYENNVYLFTNENKNLKIFYAKTLFDPFEPHPTNEKINENDNRNAGKIFKIDENIYRPVQITKPYGYGIIFRKINKLTPTEFIEKEVNRLLPDWYPELTGTHTFNIENNLIVIDGRLRVKSNKIKQVKSINGNVYIDNDPNIQSHMNKLFLKYKYNSYNVKAPFFVSTDYKSFDIYLKKLSSSSRWNYKNIFKKYNHVEYCKISKNDAFKIKNKLEKIWSNQIIRGKKAGNFGIQLKSNTHYFCCKLNNEYIMLQYVDFYENYVYCHMPMHDKILYPSLSKYAWFNLIKYIIENTNKLGIDLGGSCGKNYSHNCKGQYCNPHFKYIIENRDKLNKYKYKFIYLTKDEKNINKVKKRVIINNKLEELK